MRKQFSVFSFQFSAWHAGTLLLPTQNSKLKTKNCSRGFTLIELLATVGILVVISSMMLASNARFGGSVLLQNLAYDVALSIRQAQVYGISVRRAGTSFNVGYGVHFGSDTGPAGYVLFADTSSPLNRIYDAGSDPIVNLTTIQRGYSVQSLCATPLSGIENCATITKLDIFFVRPEPDAWISVNGLPCVPSTGANCQLSARIVLVSPRGASMSVSVANNGQIAVQQTVTNL